MDIALKIIGVWLFFDGLVSLFICAEKKFLYQAARAIRLALGIVLFFIKVG